MIGVAVACCVMASAFGLLVAALGNTPATARGVSTLAVLMMVMLGVRGCRHSFFPPGCSSSPSSCRSGGPSTGWMR
jgi:hypothetical protein